MNKSNSNSKSNSNKIGGLNFIMICIISFMYILLVTKFAEVISLNYNFDDFDINNLDNADNSIEHKQIGIYVMIIYFIAIFGMIVGYVWFSKTNPKLKNNITPNWILQWSLSVGGVILLIYTIVNYWDVLNDYSKLFLIFVSISGIIYYLYKYY